MTLNELSDAWNALRNSTLGRGTNSRVPEPLADRIGRRYEAFRAWLADEGPSGDILTSYTARKWIGEYRSLLEAAQRAGARPEHVLELTATEAAHAAAVALKRSATFGLFGVGVGVGLFVLGQVFASRRSQQ
jgi:hypothetical protein